MISRTRRGFTLVELLVVIAIIGVLVGLLIPAVNYARQTARKAECLNNVKGIGQALIQYESDKGSYPGRIERLRVVSGNQAGEKFVSWMTKLLPYLEQGNILDRLQSNTLMGPVDVQIAICPSDQSGLDIPSRLSYVINSGIWDRDLGDEVADWVRDLPVNGVSHVSYGPSPVTVNLGYLAKNDGATNTLLVTENLNAVAWMALPNSPLAGLELEEGLHGFVWSTQEAWLADSERPTADRQYAINSPAARALLDADLIKMNRDTWVSTARPSSSHSGGVNAVFCDSHAIFLREDIDPWVYNQLVSVNNMQARHPRMGMKWRTLPVPTQVNHQLTTGSY